MPRKTRSKKILAKLHRLENQQIGSNQTDIQAEPKEIHSPKISYKIQETPQTVKAANAAISTTDYRYVYKDLRKTIIFASLAIFFEVLLKILLFN